MSDDKELLRLAAKAAGIVIPAGDHHWNLKGQAVVVIDGKWHGWNSLTDDGDAFWLAVTLRMSIDRTNTTVQALTVHRGAVFQAQESPEQDPAAATRRAITRAAAKVGDGKDETP